MTEQEIQEAIHALYEGDTSTPTESQEDYLVRRIAINTGINRWENYEGTFWKELFVSLDDAADGDKTTISGTSEYNCPSDYVSPVGYVRLADGDGGSTYYTHKPTQDVQLYDNTTSGNFFYITGNKSTGRKLHLHPTPDATYTIKYDYYKSATSVTSASDIIEMSDPYFLVYFGVSRMYELDGSMDLAQKAFMEAESRLQTMAARNDLLGWWQPNSVPDSFYDLGGSAFGL